MRSAKRIEANAMGLAPAGLYFQRVTQNLRSAVAEEAGAATRPGAAPAQRAKRTELMH
jgi:hypothetical protein